MQTKKRRMRMRRSPASIVIKITTVVVIVASFFVLSNSNSPQNQHFDYSVVEGVVTGGNLIVLSGKPNVRSEPCAAIHERTIYAGTVAGAAGFGIESRSVNTSYGQIKDIDNDGAIFYVDRVLKCTMDDWNGPFYGIRLSDLSETEIKLLPKSVAKDPDGIVWISGKYLVTDNIEVVS